MVPDRLTLRGSMTYEGNVSSSPAGIIASLDHAVRSIEERLGRAEEHLAQSRQSIIEYGALVDRTYEHEARYQEVVTRQAELIEALDITKNQSVEGLDVDVIETLEVKPEVAVPVVKHGRMEDMQSAPKKATRWRMAV